MTTHSDYFRYLKSRSRIGGLYRRFWLYPRVANAVTGRALDVGCGIGDFLAFRVNTVGTDINPFCVDFCVAHGFEARRMEIDTLPFGNGEFDSVLLDNVLEHIAEPANLLAEIYRVLKSDGQLIVGVPGIRGWSSDTDHKVFYDETALIATLRSAGFACAHLFATPLWKSAFLSKKFRQYCIYGRFTRSGARSGDGTPGRHQ